METVVERWWNDGKRKLEEVAAMRKRKRRRSA